MQSFSGGIKIPRLKPCGAKLPTPVAIVITEVEIMPADIYDNRELSWLKFNERVLEEAQDINVPLLERLNFASIFQSNLDEFFMVRVGSLYDRILVNDNKKDNKTRMSPKEQLKAIFDVVRELEPQKDITYKSIMLQLREYGIEQVKFNSATKEEQEYLENYFKKEIKPMIFPLIIDKKNPFPFLQNKEIYCALQIQTKSNLKIGIIPANGQFKRIIWLGDGKRFILAEDLILHFAPSVFKNYKVIDKTLFRITRNADITAEEGLYDQDLDFREIMENLCKKRKKLQAVRMQLSESFSRTALEFLMKKLGLNDNQIFYLKTPLDLSFVGKLGDMCNEPALKYSELIPQKSSSLNMERSLIPQIKRNDVLLTYPFETIKPFISLLFEAAKDPKVTSINITLYRVAKHSQIIEALCSAAENGKEVTVLVELRARFDEENNIQWSKRLQKAGCMVIYGPRELKVHSKLLLITRKIPGGEEYITQIGTGNYNEKTSTLYTDLSLITAKREIGLEAKEVFTDLLEGRLVTDSKYLLVAPLCLRHKLMEMIDAEIELALSGEPAYIGAKVNSLCDKVLMDKLIEASQAGVKIDLIVRGICCLIPGVKEQTENITVTSIVGRYLEHSRIYIFGTKERCKMYISSADYMTRNTIRRVEVAAPILNEKIRLRLWEMFEIMLADNVKGRRMVTDGHYVHKDKIGEPLDSQVYFFEQAYKRAEKKEADRRRAAARKEAAEKKKAAEKAAAKTDTKTVKNTAAKKKKAVKKTTDK